MNKIVNTALMNALSTAGYIVLVSSFMFYMSQVKQGKPDTVFAPIAMLLLFVSSAAITGYLVFGKPILMYLEGKKKEALSLLIYTLFFLLLLTAIAFVMVVSF